MTAQRLWYSLLRVYVRFSLRFYFKRIIIHGQENIPQGPVIFAANHQNAFMDALLIVCFNTHFTYFLTRADIFKKPFTCWLLGTLNMLPIFRIRDGLQSIAENQKTFEDCTQVFIKNGAIVIFPEGNHGSQRRLRSLSKGFARVAFESLKQHPELKIAVVPVGLNYSHHQSFRASVSVYYGEPILANDYFKKQIPAELNELKNELTLQMKKLITHVEDVDNYEAIIQKVEHAQPNFLDPAGTNELVGKISKGEQVVNVDPVKMHSIIPQFIFYLALIINFIPVILWRKVKHGIKDPVFITSLRFGIGIFLFPLYWLVTGLIVFGYLGPVYLTIWMGISLTSLLALICFSPSK